MVQLRASWQLWQQATSIGNRSNSNGSSNSQQQQPSGKKRCISRILLPSCNTENEVQADSRDPTVDLRIVCLATSSLTYLCPHWQRHFRQVCATQEKQNSRAATIAASAAAAAAKQRQ